MEIFKKYLEKRKMEKEKRRIEEFLNTKIPISELYICKLSIIIDKEYTILLSAIYYFKHQEYKILKKVDNDSYLDVTTNTKYRTYSSYCVNSGDIAVEESRIPDFQRKFIEQQYMTISDIIEMNESLKKLEK